MVCIKKYFCPYCKKESLLANNPFWPFCCERCKMVDLGKWASGQYSVPGEPVTSDQDKEEKEEDEK